jgi:hypothetical protein
MFDSGKHQLGSTFREEQLRDHFLTLLTLSDITESIQLLDECLDS